MTPMTRVLHYLTLTLLALLCVFPFWWTLVTALAGAGDPFAFPPPLLPARPTLHNFAQVFETIPMLGFLRNSLAITALTVFWKLTFCALAAYPLARMRFRGRRLALGLILATLVLPGEANFLANFITITRLGLVDTYTGVILPNLVNAVSILLLKQGFEEIPQDLIDAARVDGASDWRIFRSIVLPLTAPWLATVGILSAVETWNDYVWPSIVMSTPDRFPLAAGILYLRGTYGSSVRVVAAGTVLAILPTLAAFLFTQRFFMRGMDGAVK